MYTDPLSFFFSFELRFYGPVNLLVSCQVGLVTILTLFLGRLSPLRSLLELVHILSSVTDTTHLESGERGKWPQKWFNDQYP